MLLNLTTRCMRSNLNHIRLNLRLLLRIQLNKPRTASNLADHACIPLFVVPSQIINHPRRDGDPRLLYRNRVQGEKYLSMYVARAHHLFLLRLTTNLCIRSICTSEFTTVVTITSLYTVRSHNIYLLPHKAKPIYMNVCVDGFTPKAFCSSCGRRMKLCDADPGKRLLYTRQQHFSPAQYSKILHDARPVVL